MPSSRHKSVKVLKMCQKLIFLNVGLTFHCSEETIYKQTEAELVQAGLNLSIIGSGCYSYVKRGCKMGLK